MKTTDFLTELSTDKLAQYKTAAAADASKADKEGDFKRGDKRFSGIVKATKKQFANDTKQDVAEEYELAGVDVAYELGRKAYKERKTIRDNPYSATKEARKYDEWEKGLERGKYDAIDAKRFRSSIKEQGVDEGWSQKYKSSINCSHPKGFSQKAHCAGKKKHNESIDNIMEMTCPDCGMCETHVDHTNLEEACWKGYHKEGNKKMFGKTYPNCVKNEGVAEGEVVPFPKKHPYELLTNCPKCGGSLQGGKDEKGRLKMCIPCMTLYRAPIQQGVAEGSEQINEYRDRLLQYVKSLLPTWPDYVLKDWLVPNKGDFSNLPTDALKNGVMEKVQGAGLTPNSKWQLVPDMKFTMDMFDPMTKQRLIGRAGGSSDLGMGIPKDKERHATQAALAQQQGGVRKEPVLLIKTAKGYELLEGWHRTIQHFVKYPEGYTGPAYIAVAQSKQGVAEEQHSCPHCGGEMVSEELMNEKKDACYYKVKSRYKVWPSAYASGALVKCRNKGASNWGNGGKKNESSILEGINRADESLHDWFNKEKWVRMDTKGNIKGPCAKEPGEGKPKCLPQSKAHSLGKKGRASAAARKRREDPNPDRSGKAINVDTKKK